MMANKDEKFERIYNKYKNLIAKVAGDITNDYHLAQDICQKTFEKLYGYQDYIDEERVKSWLVVVASNEARDYCRKGGKYSLLFSGTMAMECFMEPENCIDLHVDKLVRKELLYRMLEDLYKKNADWYEVFMLAEYLEIPRRLIAKRRGISLSTVDAYLRKTRKWLVSRYEKDYKQL